MKLYLPRREGGIISLSNVGTYNLSCLLHIGLDWLSQSSRYPNYLLESTMAQPYLMAALLHSKLTPPSLQHNLLHNLLLMIHVHSLEEIKKEPEALTFHIQASPNPGKP